MARTSRLQLTGQPRSGRLFEDAGESQTKATAPLAERMRPAAFDEFVGQQHILAEDRVLRRSIEADRVPSLLFWGPPGSGKTTLARLIATTTRAHFEPVSAVSAGVADLRRAVSGARELQSLYQRPTILFVDEIHRFNKAQQDVILPHVEDGTITFIGATTENPSFEVNAPLLSRCRVFTLHALDADAMTSIVRRALSDEKRGLGLLAPELEADALSHLVNIANGDARVALNALEMAVVAAEPAPDGVRRIGVDAISDALQRRTPQYDKAGDSHYDTISAFIKSVRGSSPDGALYWLARMLEAGEDPLFIARRLVILAAEDIGLANPGALPVAVAAQQAVHFIGLPEGRIPAGRGDGVPGDLAEEQRRLRGPRARDGGRAERPARTGAAAPAERAHGVDAQHGLRRGLQVQPRLRRQLREAGVPAARLVRSPLLRTVRPGFRGRDRRAAPPLVGRRQVTDAGETCRSRASRPHPAGGASG